MDATTTNHLNSADADAWDLPLQLDPGPKLRLMCSYGGHIIPRPHDQSLCYVGGDTRIVVVDRHSSLSSLLSRLARTLFHGRQFTLKYQLPDDDLDSLISVTTDDDFLNMIDEYDRTVTSSKPSRLRLFLFLAKPETATSMGSLLDDAKSETRFVDALNGAALLQRGVSDSAAVNNLLEFDGFVNSDCCKDLEAHNENFNKQVNSVIDIESNLPDSPLVETNSSFGSGSSCPSTPNLAPINVRVEDQIVGLDEKFSNISVAAVQAATVSSNVGSGENPGRVMGDEERSDPRAASGFRKPPLPLQLGPRKICNDSNCSLLSPDSKHASPDSVASDTSIVSVTSLPKQALYLDSTAAAIRDTRAPPTLISSPNNLSEPSSQILMHQVQHQQQQFFHTNLHYVHHSTTSPMPVSSYYPLYPTPSPQQYQMYLMPITKSQPYNVAVQNTSAGQNLITIKNTATVSSAGYEETGASPIFQNMAVAPTVVQVQANQFQQQCVNISQMPRPSKYAQPAHKQVYYTQHLVIPSQCQTMTPSTAVGGNVVTGSGFNF
ncbi:hypothetical protein LguiA_009299 [Lonicera macranthoides]